ncbi:MAG: carbon storage regulator CsrA [Oscillospiraceae bacterium]|nr:carbon storage regulator CsrA [Oscillospiraceae bacterium]MCH5207742.1 carbon storage regulator CsrA [Oscillospiraceae bacterium]
MLVITRKVGESIIISDKVEVSVLEVVGDKVKLGINAPREIKIIRSELKIAKETNVQSAEASAGLKQLLNKGKQEEN